ncbi:MAG: hypothetical protein A2V85_02790 [Chloroflexi bacterium RBG_16_72_14]|nr:MAG: hypothetical protein A2V85_02790 [Chloroflexi bacterium RBG_16_72_14]
MHARSRWSLVVVGLVALGALAGWPPAVSGADIVADLDGRPIAPKQVGGYYCHDFEFPRIHCYLTEGELDAAVSALEADPLAAAVTGITYVRVYVDGGYTGASAYLSQDYPDLGVIGWQDRISSFKALNSQSGRFHEHNSYLGFQYSFCCNTWVTYVGDAYNDRFSSVKNTT